MAFDPLKRTGRSGRRALLPGVPLVLGLALLLGVYEYDHNRSDVIASGVRIGGVNVGGLRAPAAGARLRAALRRTRSDWITVHYGALRFTLTGTQAHLDADVNGAVQEAVKQSRGGWFLGRTIRDLFGGRLDRNLPLPVTFSRGTVQELIARVRSAIDRPARNPRMTVRSGAQLVTSADAVGTAVDVVALRGELAQALRAPTTPHALTVRVRRIQPKVTTAMLASEYPAYIVVDRPHFKLFLYQHLHLTHTYSIAVGRADLETPAGLHHVLDKQINPSWHVPHSAWAGRLAGQVMPPGPQDPLVARWMAIDDLGCFLSYY